MNTIPAIGAPTGDQSNRSRVAAEVRAALARVRIPVYKISSLVGDGGSRAYWSRRINGDVAFDIDDLTVIASLTGTSIADLVATATETVPTPPNPRAGGGARLRAITLHEVGPAGIEPATSTVESRRLAPVIPLRAPEPTANAI